MNIAMLIIISITLAVSVYLALRRQVKPRIKVYFPDDSTQASYRAKEETNIAIHIKNRGRFGFPKPVATNMTIFVYTPISFSLRKLKYMDVSETRVAKAPSGGIFGGMHYLTLSPNVNLNLFHGEEETITALMQMPEETGKQTIKVAVFSNEGDLGVHELEIIVS
jgi:hypothetical protein